jgi:hypothetical protein
MIDIFIILTLIMILLYIKILINIVVYICLFVYYTIDCLDNILIMIIKIKKTTIL